MNQRPLNSRVKDPRKEKFTRVRQDEEERLVKDEEIPKRSSSERSLPSLPLSTHFRIKESSEKFRSSSRDGHNSLIFRRQERGKVTSCRSKGTTPENSPGRISQTNSLKSEGVARINGNGNSSGFQTVRESRDFTLKRTGTTDNQNSDDRLLRLLQHLERDDERERQLLAFRQIKEFFNQPENHKILSLNLNEILSTFEDLLHQRLYNDAKQELITCLVTLTAALGSESKSIYEWIFSTYNMSVTDDARLILLKAVHETLKCDKSSSKLTDVITIVMTNIQSALENADMPDLLVAIVDVILEISVSRPSIFSNHFRDTVDILVGWHIDSSQSHTLTQYTSQALISFQQFWILDISFSLTLLGQFLEDMEAYAEDLVQTKSQDGGYGDGHPDDQPPAPEECLAKITCLIRVFTTVLKSLGNHASPTESNSVTWDFLVERLKSFLKCIMMALEYTYQDSLVTAANECLCILLNLTQSHSVEAVDQLLSYINLLQTRPVSFMTESLIISVIQLMVSFVKAVNTNLPLEFVSSIFASNSLCQCLRFSPYHKIQQHVLALQHAVLGVKNVPVLEEAYKCILCDIQVAYSVILGSECQPFIENCGKAKQVKYTTFRAETALLSNLCALTEIGNAKHSIIGMWALKPSFFDLMAHYLQPSSKLLATRYPSVQYAVIYALYSHSTRHSHFISSSSLISQNLPNLSPSNGSSLSGHNSPILASVPVIPPPSSGHLNKILNLLSTLLIQEETPYSSRLLILRWSLEVLDSLQHHISRLIHIVEFVKMIEAVIDTSFMNDTAITCLCCSVLQALLKYAVSNLPDVILFRCYEVCLLKLCDHDVEVRDAYCGMLVLLPLDIAVSGFPGSVSHGAFHNDIKSSNLNENTTTLLDIWTARRGHMSKICSASSVFQSHHFKTIMVYILQGIQPKSKDWLVRLFFSCQYSEKPTKSEKMMMKLIESNSSVMWFWATWEIAQSCVLNKLRTPLGKPQETFMSIEATIKSYAKQIGKFETGKSGSKEESDSDILRVFLLLDLVEHLEKLMYNAYEGCAVALPPPPKTVRTFFRTNKATCQEWLSRVRMATLAVALYSGQMAIALRQGYHLLQEMKESGNTQGPEFEHALMYVVEALIGLHCPEAILGLYTWCKENIGCKYTWVKAAVDQAAGRFETAAHEYTCILRSLTNPSSPSIFIDAEISKEDKFKSSISIFSEGKNSLIADDTAVVKVLSHLDLGNSTAKSESDSSLNSFLLNQVVNCYRNVGSWAEAMKWTDMQHKIKWNQNGVTQKMFSETDLTYLRALSVFEDTLKYPIGGNRTSLDFTGISSQVMPETLESPIWEVQEHLHEIEKFLLSVAVSYETKPKPSLDEMKSIGDLINKAAKKILNLMNVSALDWPPSINPNQAALYISASSLLTVFQKGRKISPAILRENLKVDPPDHSVVTFNNALLWNAVWLHLSAKEQGIRPQTGSSPIQELHLVAARLARKQQNLRLAQKLLLRNATYIAGSNSSTSHMLHSVSPSHFNDSANLLKLLRCSVEMLPTEKLVKLQREGAKLLYSWGDTEGASDVLLKSSLSVMKKIIPDNRTDHLSFRNLDINTLSELNTRSLLSLVKYLQQESKHLNEIEEQSITKNYGTSKLLNMLLEMENITSVNLKNESFELKNVFNELCPDGIMGEPDFVVGRLLQLGVNQCPALAKSWSALASWCYRWGRKAVDSASEGYVDLTPDEKHQVLDILPEDICNEDREATLQITSHIHSSDDEWSNTGLDTDETETMKRRFLFGCPSLQSATNRDTIVDCLIDVHKKVVCRTYSYYTVAAKAYFQYLHLNGQCSQEEKSEDDNVTATLRLLRLVVKHASELRDILEQGLAKTPTAPWRGIIPQLFSRLNHPEQYVRQSISDLLCRVAQASPHLIVFPAVVGSLTLKVGPGLQEESTGLLGTYFSGDIESSSTIPDLETNCSQSPEHTDLPPTISAILSEEDESEEEQQKTAIMQNCFAALVETLGRQDARTIAEVKNLVHELRRITLLWDELWLGTLNLHHSEINRRILTLEDEIKKVQINSSLTKDEKAEIIREKHNVFIKPTLYILEQLQSISGQPPETPHEKWFQETFGKHIESTIHKLANPVEPGKPQNSWALFKQLHHMLQQKVQQQTRSHLLMEQISPLLFSLKSTVIPMPGINIKSSSVVTIESVHNSVSILPTKTKPKKLAFFGSDGKKYTYLFKGLEDLHLDERIMQFLSIVNNMFIKNKRHGKVVYNARHYSVTPLGPRSGLIQWVDGATPLFGLYKRWQQREAVAQATKAMTSVGSVAPTAILRPSEVYYNKLTPLLKDKGITNLENRKEWPLTVLLEVLKELMEETPKDLLAKELWCSCSSALEWWEVTQTYNHSTAVMSVIGYIIGLGDRHLDNVLVDLNTGEVVHIDYNVCFEKGKNLRVPEKVPFRMTTNIETALGVTGVEGTFRVSCEHVLKVLRKGRETLLTLLEAFVYDPLVDWTPGNEGGYTGAVYGGRQAWAMESKQTKQEMEKDIACSMFAIRVAEMKADWLKNRDEVLASLPKLESGLKTWREAQIELQSAETLLQEACQEKALLEEAQVIPNHSLYTLPKRFEECAVVKGTVKSAREAVKEKLAECKKWNSHHSGALKSVCGSELGKLCTELPLNRHIDNLSVAPVVEFLQSAGQGQLVQQCEHAESELGSLLHQQQMTLRTCMELLTTYATIVLQYPLSFKEQNRCSKWQQWLEDLLENFTVQKCQTIIGEFRNAYGIESMDVNSIQTSCGIHFQIQTQIGEINTKLVNVLERRQLENLHDSNALSSYVEDSKNNITHFIKENKDHGYVSFLCVVVTALCALNKRLLVMESASAAAGDCLVDMTSWGGDWFLDEIYSMSNNIAQFFRLLQDLYKDENQEMKTAFHAANSVYGVFTALEDLSLNFQNIILPEALKAVQAEESSVLDMITKLNSIIGSVEMPMDNLITELETNVRSIIMDVKNGEDKASGAVNFLKSSFESLMKGSEPEIADLTSGQMLLMGFNGLFIKLECDLGTLLSALDNLNPPITWKKVDIVKESATLLPPVHLSSTRSILADIFFLKRLQTMQKFFNMCKDFADRLQIIALKTIDKDGPLLTNDQMFKPVKTFIAEYVRKQVLGLPSQTIAYVLCTLISSLGVNINAEIELRDIGVESKVSLEELSKKAVDISIKQEKFQSGQLTQASTLTSNFDAHWRKEDFARRLDQSVLLLKASLQRAQLQLARYQWLNEDLLVQGNIGPLQNFAVPARVTVMSEMRKTVQALISLESAIAISQERYLSLTSSIEQRLKWAAGANPSLSSVQEEFEAAITEKTTIVTTANQLYRDLINICNALLHFEALRTRTSEALSSDSTFLSLINRCQESCILAENCSSQVSTVEEHLLALKPLPEKGGVSQEWITSVMEKVSLSLGTCKEKLDEKKSNSFLQWDVVKNHVMLIRSLLSTHHRLMSDVRHILRTLAKHEEQHLGLNCKHEGSVHSYITMYKSFSEHLSTIVRDVLAEGQDLDLSRNEKIIKDVKPLVISAEDVYNRLISLAGPLGSKRLCRSASENDKIGAQKCTDTEKQGKSVEQNKKTSTLSTQTQELFCVASPVSQSAAHRPSITGGQKKSSVMRDPRTGKIIQERNSYATSVWRRVKMKLDGRDPDPNKRSTIAEQVDFVIKEATNLENLAVLYEGWTPWV